MDRGLIEKAIEQAKNQESNLVIWDRRDTFTIEPDELAEIETNDDYLRVRMENGKATVYVEYDAIYKVVVERERLTRRGSRAGFGALSS